MRLASSRHEIRGRRVPQSYRVRAPSGLHGSPRPFTRRCAAPRSRRSGPRRLARGACPQRPGQRLRCWRRAALRLPGRGAGADEEARQSAAPRPELDRRVGVRFHRAGTGRSGRQPHRSHGSRPVTRRNGFGRPEAGGLVRSPSPAGLRRSRGVELGGRPSGRDRCESPARPRRPPSRTCRSGRHCGSDLPRWRRGPSRARHPRARGTHDRRDTTGACRHTHAITPGTAGRACPLPVCMWVLERPIPASLRCLHRPFYELEARHGTRPREPPGR